MVVRGWVGREQEVTTDGYWFSSQGGGNVLELDSGDGEQHCEYAKKHNATLICILLKG